jgi:hypothetical protein
MQIKNEAPLWVCAMVFVCGILAYAVTGTIDVLYAVSTTIDSVFTAGKAAGMVICSAFAIGLASLAGFCFRSRKCWIGLALLVSVIPFMAYSMHNGVRYVGGQSMVKEKLTEARRQQSVDLANLKNRQATENRDWLRRTYLQTKDKTEKDKLLAQAVAPIELTTPTIEAEMPDAGAEVLADILHVDKATVEKWSTAAFPVLLVLAKVLGPLIGSAFWPQRKLETAKGGSTGGDRNIGNSGNSSGEIIQFPAVSVVSSWKQQAKSIASPVSIPEAAANGDAMETPAETPVSNPVSNRVSEDQKDKFPLLSVVSKGAPSAATGARRQQCRLSRGGTPPARVESRSGPTRTAACLGQKKGCRMFAYTTLADARSDIVLDE